MVYIYEKIRDYSNVAKSKIHYAEGDKNYGMSQIELMQKQMGETLQKLVEGLAQVAQAVAQPYEQGSGREVRKRMRCWYHENENHDISSCKGFASLDSQSKINLVRKNGACFSCLRSGHVSRRCNEQRRCDQLNNNQQRCGKMHHPTLHVAHVEGISFHNSVNLLNDSGQRGKVLLMVTEIDCR